MKKRIATLLCSLALVCALALPVLGSSGSTVYLLAIGDKFYDSYRPVSINGAIYVPYTIFDRNTTKVDLGVYYGITPERGTILSLYSLSGILTFYIQMGVCEDNQGNAMDFHAYSRNGIPYVPAAAVCNFFGLKYSVLPTSDRGTLIRITNPASQAMDDWFFVRTAQDAMAYRYNQIIQEQTPSPTSTPPPQPTSSRAPDATHNGNTKVFFALDASQATGDWTGLFPSGCYALFLFTPDSLAGQAPLVRKAVAAGHSVGLLADPTLEPREMLEQLEEGNALLSHIARIKTRIYAFSGDSSAVRADTLLSRTDALNEKGWVRWESNWRTAANPANVQRMLSGGPSVVRMDLSRTNISQVYRVVSTLQNGGYDLRRPLETEL